MKIDFKKGDQVVVITNALGNKFTWEVVGFDGCMVEISQIGQPNEYEWVHYMEIAYATPEGIQANRRLDQINCWSCGKTMTHKQRSENDGFCVHCNAEVCGG